MNLKTKSGSERLAREILAGYDPEIIDSMHAIVVGAGALGQAIVLALALIGVRHVTIIDMGSFDDESNITRSPYWKEGAPKAVAVAEGAQAMCTAEGAVHYYALTSMVQWLGDAIFVGHSAGRALVFCAVDCQDARAWTAQRCRYLGVPLVEGGFRGHRFNLSVFPNSGDAEPCWACDVPAIKSSRVFSCDAYARRAIADQQIPAIATCSFCVGNWMVEAGLSLLHGNQELSNKAVFGDLRGGGV